VTPPNTRATRSARLDEVLRGRAAGYALGIGTVAALVTGAALRSPLFMLLGPLAVAGVVLGVARAHAGSLAAADFFQAFAAGHDLTYYRDWELLPLTPLLGAGDRRHCEHYMCSDDRALAHYVYETCEGSDDDGHTRTHAHRFTICTRDIEPAMASFPGLFLQHRRDLVGTLTEERWLSRGGRHAVELESAAFGERYDLMVDREQDELLLRELFSPSFVVWLAGHPLAPCFEFSAGTLVVYVRRQLCDSGSLNLLLMATQEIADRISAEADEERAGLRAAASAPSA
jgi:hypothetical protein